MHHCCDQERNRAEGKRMSFVFSPSGEGESAEDRQGRTVSAADIISWLVDPSNIGQPLVVQHAIVDGPLDLSFRNIDSNVSIIDSVLTEQVEFSGTTLRHGLRLDGSHLHREGGFSQTKILGEFSARAAVFDELTSFTSMQVELDLDIRQAQFRQRAEFRRVIVDQDARFDEAWFHQDAGLENFEVRGSTILDAARFDGTVSFDEAQLHGTVYCRSTLRPAVFGGDALFTDAKFGGIAFFQSTEFRRANFSRASSAVGFEF
jgi:hypothetical protein